MDISPDTELNLADEGPVISAIRRVNRFLHYMAGAVVIILMLLVVAHVIGKMLRPRRPVPGITELTEFGMLIMIYLGFGYAEHHRDHITVDLLYEKLKRTGQAILSVFSGLVSMWVVWLMLSRLAAFATTLRNGHYITLDIKWPMWPFAWVAVLGAAAYLAAVVCTTILNIRQARRGTE